MSRDVLTRVRASTRSRARASNVATIRHFPRSHSNHSCRQSIAPRARSIARQSRARPRARKRIAFAFAFAVHVQGECEGTYGRKSIDRFSHGLALALARAHLGPLLTTRATVPTRANVARDRSRRALRRPLDAFVDDRARARMAFARARVRRRTTRVGE